MALTSLVKRKVIEVLNSMPAGRIHVDEFRRLLKLKRVIMIEDEAEDILENFFDPSIAIVRTNSGHFIK